jgi:hypothetical protein
MTSLDLQTFLRIVIFLCYSFWFLTTKIWPSLRQILGSDSLSEVIFSNLISLFSSVERNAPKLNNLVLLASNLKLGRQQYLLIKKWI